MDKINTSPSVQIGKRNVDAEGVERGKAGERRE